MEKELGKFKVELIVFFESYEEEVFQVSWKIGYCISLVGVEVFRVFLGVSEVELMIFQFIRFFDVRVGYESIFILRILRNILVLDKFSKFKSFLGFIFT